MKLQGFKHITQEMADKIEKDFVLLAECYGTIGLGYDLKNIAILECFGLEKQTDYDALAIELIELRLILQALFTMRIHDITWHEFAIKDFNLPRLLL